MSEVTHVWMENPYVQRKSSSKQMQPYEMRIQKATANLARRLKK